MLCDGIFHNAMAFQAVFLTLDIILEGSESIQIQQLVCSF